MSDQLSAGTIQAMYVGLQIRFPVVQVLDITKIPVGTADRYRFV